MLLATLLSLLLEDEMRVRRGSTSVCLTNLPKKRRFWFFCPTSSGAVDCWPWKKLSLLCMYNYQGSDVIHTSSPAFDTQSPPLACCKRLFTKPQPICRKPWKNIQFISSCRLRIHWYLSSREHDESENYFHYKQQHFVCCWTNFTLCI